MYSRSTTLVGSCKLAIEGSYFGFLPALAVLDRKSTGTARTCLDREAFGHGTAGALDSAWTGSALTLGQENRGWFCIWTARCSLGRGRRLLGQAAVPRDGTGADLALG